MIKIVRYIVLLIVIVLVQLLICNNIQFSGYINPYMYILFILVLPVQIQTWMMLLIAFGLGFLIDVFCDTMGLHIFATVAAAFVRPFVLSIVAPRDGYDPMLDLSMHSYGIKWYLTYSSIIVFVHHFLLFYLEVFRLSNFFGTLLRVILSSIISLIFIVLCEFVRRWD